MFVGEIRQARFLNGALTGGYALTFIFTGNNAESMEGGMLMKSKYRTYGKEIALCNSCYYHLDDNISYKSTVAAPLAQERLL